MGLIAGEGSDLARRVAVRRFDFDHVGAHIGEHASSQRTLKVRQIENAQSCQCSGT